MRQGQLLQFCHFEECSATSAMMFTPPANEHMGGTISEVIYLILQEKLSKAVSGETKVAETTATADGETRCSAGAPSSRDYVALIV